jgi:hypothetical protein
MARNGGLESDPNWQPEQNIARVAINNERQALLFVFIIIKDYKQGISWQGDTVTRGEA